MQIDPPEILCHTFLSSLFPAAPGGPLVIDLGGNRGPFARAMIKHFGARVYLLEPVPELFRDIPAQDNLVKFEEAISTRDGTISLKIPADRCATIYEDLQEAVQVTVRTIGLQTLFSRLPPGDIDLMKMDIEGAEMEIFEAVSPELLRRARQITVEFHDFLYPDLLPRVKAIQRRLAGFGYYVINFSRFTNGDVLFVRRDLISRAQYLFLKYPLKYARGAPRLLRRLFSLR